MEIRTLGILQVADPSQVAEARRFAMGLARSLEFDETLTGTLGIIVTEAATNLVKHAGEGELIFNGLQNGPRHGIGVLSLDRGPGIENLGESLRDGHSTAGSPGTGLGAIMRLASQFDIYSRPGAGTAVLARVWAGREPPPMGPPGPVEIGAVSIPKRGESVCGDAWTTRRDGSLTRLLVADGLGHGIEAAEAATQAVRFFNARSGPPAEVLEEMHAALRHTRGAAAAMAEVDAGRRLVRYAGVGNISGTIVAPEREYNMVSHNGTMGHEVRHFREFTYPWPEQALLVLHTDGVSHRWDLRSYAGLATRTPMIVAGVLYRDFRRDRDDVTVVVARDAPPGGPR